MAAIVAAMALLRVVALTSDPYLRLDWCTGLITDEGYYTHNARNIALFGHARTDEFNNMVLSPLLHAIQTAVFTVSGAGAVQSRLISVAFSLVTLVFFWAALRRAFGLRAASIGTLFLGLDHTYLLFNRMALMDTPAALFAVAAFYAFVRAHQADASKGRYLWLSACGALNGVTVVVRSLCVYVLPAPFVALRGARAPLRSYGALAAGVVACLGLYAALWYVPHRAEIGHMNAYYRREQIQPKSLHRLRVNVIDVGLLGDEFGMTSYLLRHTPVASVLALIGISAALIRRVRKRRHAPWTRAGAEEERANPRTAYMLYLAVWLLSGWILFAVSSYSPDRYFVSTYPALFGLAAVSLTRLRANWSALREPGPIPALLRTALAWILTYHAIEAIVHQGGVLPASVTRALLYGGPTLVALLAAARWEPRSATADKAPRNRSHRLAAAVVALWLVVNALWLADWARTLGYTQQSLDRWLARNLPANSVLIGDVAPGVTLQTRLPAVCVIPGLCNGRRPIERFAGRPEYVVILDGAMKEPYWLQHYRSVVAPENCVRRATVVKWDVGIYRVSPLLPPGPATSTGVRTRSGS